MKNDGLFARVNALPIESVVREYFSSLELKHEGREIVGHCPFHDENTPSFHVRPEKNKWHCFGSCAKGGSNIDLLLMGEIASKPLDAAKELARKFGIEIKDEKPARKTKALTVSDYADFCGLPESYLRETFRLTERDAGVEIPYKDEGGTVVSIQRRHKLEKGNGKDGRFSWRKGDKPIAYGLWLLPSEKKRLVIVEGASDVHVLTHCGLAGVPCAAFQRYFHGAFRRCFRRMFGQPITRIYQGQRRNTIASHVTRSSLVSLFSFGIGLTGCGGKVALLKQLSTQFDIPKRPQYCRAAQRPPWCGKYAVLRIVLTWSIEKRQATCKDNASSFCKDYVIRVVVASR